MRNGEVDKTVDVASQLLKQNVCSDCQVKYQSKRNVGFQKTVQTPLSVGLPLSVHANVRNNNLTVYIGCDYKNK